MPLRLNDEQSLGGFTSQIDSDDYVEEYARTSEAS